MARIDIRRWALLGAQERLTQLSAEASEIYKAFPELRSHAIGFGKRTGRSRAKLAAGGETPSASQRPRRTLSAEARKRISDAQKARWAKHRKEAKKS